MDDISFLSQRLVLERGARIRAEESLRLASLEILEEKRALIELNQSLNKRLAECNDKIAAIRTEHDQQVRQMTEGVKHLGLYAEVIRSTGEAIAIADLHGRIVEVNPAYEAAIGRPRDELVGTDLYGCDPDPRFDTLHAELWRSVERDGHWVGEIFDRRSNGESFPAWTRVNAVRDDHGNAMHYAAISRDITLFKQNELQLQRLAFYDGLTQLPNRALFTDRLRIALATAQREKRLVAVLYIDLDRFKYVNDTLGHAAGDRLLVEISQRLSRCMRASETIARMGGDEFTILLTDIASEADAGTAAERIMEAIELPVQLNHQVLYIGASIGISVYPRDGSDAEAMQKNADRAMYEAKDAGRGQYRVFDSEMDARGSERLSLSVQMDVAIKKEEFTLFYQPIINLAGGVEGVEALIRWQKPDGEMVAPAKFIPHAEETGLIRKLDCWVLERACNDAMAWLQEGRDLPVSVNLSAVSIQQPNMAKIIESILKRTGLPPRLLNIEVTETAVISDPHAARRILEEVVSLGVGLSLDDFGTGYSSLSYLTRFPINCIKLDQVFIDRIGKDSASEEVIQSLLQLAQKLKLRVVAEGIEEQEQQSFLAGAGCELMQGFHFARPMPRAHLMQWLADSGRQASSLIQASRQTELLANG